MGIAGMEEAIASIEKGMAGAFLQTTAAATIKKLAMNSQKMMDADRQDILSFLAGETQYAPQSGEIVGILKTMEDEMNADIADVTEAEESAIAGFEELKAAKNKEINALTKSIEEK